MPRPAGRRGTRPAACLGGFAGAFSALVAFSVVARHQAWWNDRRVAAVHARIPAGDDYYLANFHAGIEHMVFYHGLDGVPDRLRNADVLFLGDSHVQFDWPRETLEPFFKARRMTYYNMAFGYHETSAFPLAIIRKFDLHPAYVVINVDPFFSGRPSTMAAEAMRDTAFAAFKFRLETTGSFYAQRWVHAFLPGLTGQFVPGDEIYYRSRSDGTIQVAASVDMRVPVPKRTWPEDDWYHALPAAAEFQRELTARGATLVFTKGPMSSAADVSGLAENLRNPPVILVPFQPGLTTFDGAHLDRASAVRFSGAFLDLFGKYLDARRRPRPAGRS